MRVDDWFLQPGERGNDATDLDSRHPDGSAWSAGNEVRPLVHGATYFAELLAAIRRMRAGDLLMFTDWRGDPDERLDGPGTEVGTVLCEAAERGVYIKGLVWRSHLDRLTFSADENRHLGEEIEAAGGECLLDMRVRTGGAHHQKFVVLRHPGRPELDVAYVGGIDLCHSRRDDATHVGDPQVARWRPVRAAPAVARHPGGDPRSGRRGRRDGLPRTVGRSAAADPQSRPPRAGSMWGDRRTPVRCRRGCRIRRRWARKPCSCCGRTRIGSSDIRSRRTVSAVSPAVTARRWGRPGRWCTSRTSTCGRRRWRPPMRTRCGTTRSYG